MPDTTLGIKAGAVKKAVKAVAPVNHRTPRERKQTGNNEGCWPLAVSWGQVIFNDLSFYRYSLNNWCCARLWGNRREWQCSRGTPGLGKVKVKFAHPWKSPGQNTGVGSFSLLGNVFTNQGDLFKQKEGSFSSRGSWSRLCRSESWRNSQGTWNKTSTFFFINLF